MNCPPRLSSDSPANDVDPLPAPSLQRLAAHLGARTLARARLYDAWRAVYEGQVRGAALKARCEGSLGEAWRVSVTLQGDGALDARCTCPVGAEGACKHVGATLLAWRARPGRFASAPALRETLQNLDVTTLREVLTALAARSSELESLVESMLPDGPAAPEAAGWGERVGEAFRAAGGQDNAGELIAQSVERLLDESVATIGAGDLPGLAAMHGEVLRAVLGRARRLGDGAAPLRAVVRRCLDATADAAREIPDPVARRVALWSLVDLVAFDIERGVAAHASAPGRLAVRRAVEVSSADDRAWLAERVRDRMEDAEAWALRAWSIAYAELTEGAMSDGPWLELCREHQLHALIARRLLHLGRHDEALRAAGSVSDASLLELGDAFTRAGRSEAFEALVTSRVERSSEAHRVRMAAWLSARAEARRDDLAAAEIAEVVLRARPTREALEVMHRAALRAGTWDEARERVYALLEQTSQPLLAEALIHDGELSRAVDYVTSPRALTPSFRGVRAALVARLETTDARAAARVLHAQALGLIAQRGRASYAEACAALSHARRLLGGVGNEALAAQWIDELRAQHAKRPALVQLLDLHFGEPARAAG